MLPGACPPLSWTLCGMMRLGLQVPFAARSWRHHHGLVAPVIVHLTVADMRFDHLRTWTAWRCHDGMLLSKQGASDQPTNICCWCRCHDRVSRAL